MTAALAFTPNSSTLHGRSSGRAKDHRREFSLPADAHYLNCAYMAPMSRRVEASAVDALHRHRHPVDLPPEEYFRGPDSVRESFAKLVNAGNPRRVALVPAVSYAMAIAAQNLELSAGQNVVVIGDEFPSAVLPWRRLAKRSNAEVRTVTAPEVGAGVSRGAVWNERLLDAIDAKTGAVILSNVHWSDGTLFDVERLAKRARDVGAAVMIDGTQSVGALPFDVAKVQPDLLVCAGYKWLTGPYGLSVAYVGPRFDDGMPLEDNWTSQVGAEDFANLAEYQDTYRGDAARYDGGQRASFLLTPMLHTAIEQLLDWGVDHIQAHCAQLFAPWLERLATHGIVTEDPAYRASHLVGLRFTTQRDLSQVAERLAARKVSVSVRGDAVRVSPHLYNTSEDVEALVSALVARDMTNA